MGEVKERAEGEETLGRTATKWEPLLWFFRQEAGRLQAMAQPQNGKQAETQAETSPGERFFIDGILGGRPTQGEI